MFKKNKYIVVRNAVSPEMCEFLYNYLLFKKNYYNYVKNNKEFFGNLNSLGASEDTQVKKSYSLYGSIVLDMFLDKIKPKIEQATKLTLVPTYSYGRVYVKGNKLPKHIDRKPCEISASLCLGGDPWEIYFQDKKKKVKILLNTGDLAIYRGLELPHWRTPFKGKECCQVFIHYNNLDGPYKDKYIFDNRPFLGAPKPVDWSTI